MHDNEIEAKFFCLGSVFIVRTLLRKNTAKSHDFSDMISAIFSTES